MDSGDNRPSMPRRLLMPVLAVILLAAIPAAAQGARDITTLKQRADAVEAEAARLDAAAGAAEAPCGRPNPTQG